MVRKEALSVERFDAIASTKEFLFQAWKGDMSACAEKLTTDFLFVGPFDESLGIGASKFVELRIKLQPLLQRLEYTMRQCEIFYRNPSVSICLAIISISDGAEYETKLANVVTWKDTPTGTKLAYLVTFIPVDINLRGVGYGRSMIAARALTSMPTQAQRPLVMKDNSGRNHVVDPAKTGYLEAQHQYCVVHISPEPFRIRESLTSTLERFPSYFVRVHRSYAVNALMVSSIGRNEITLANGERVPIPTRQSTAIRSLILATISSVLDGTESDSNGSVLTGRCSARSHREQEQKADAHTPVEDGQSDPPPLQFETRLIRTSRP